jgi:PAP2 superfamily
MFWTIDPHWILNCRCDALTLFFKIFPFFASDYFFMSAIGIGYWLRPQIPLFIHLGFLIPFSTLINRILKLIFSIPRPPSSLHLISLQDPWGFPSGDAQIGTVFWGCLFLASSSRFVRIFCAGMIATMMASRVYLGVHSLNDVVAGFLFGVLILCLWNNSYVQRVTSKWFEGKRTSLYLLIAAILLLYLIVSHGAFYSSRLLACVGVLLGYSYCLPYLHAQIPIFQPLSFKKILIIMGSLASLVIFAKSMSFAGENNFILYSSVIVKYAILAMMVYIFFPKYQQKIMRMKFFSES